MKTKIIWIMAVVCAILLCGCSHSEEPVARTSDSSSTAESSWEEPKTDGSHSFSESEEGQPESSKSVESAAPSSGQAAPEYPISTSSREQPAAQRGNTAPASSNQSVSAGSEENDRQLGSATSPVQQSANSQPPVEPEQPAIEPPVPTEPPTPTEPPAPAFDVSSYVGFAQSYGQGIGLSLDSTATACWDDPLTANSGCVYLERDLRDRLNWYAASGFTAFCVWAEDAGGGNYLIYIGYA